jgi:hypothetical protein
VSEVSVFRHKYWSLPVAERLAKYDISLRRVLAKVYAAAVRNGGPR